MILITTRNLLRTKKCRKIVTRWIHVQDMHGQQLELRARSDQRKAVVSIDQTDNNVDQHKAAGNIEQGNTKQNKLDNANLFLLIKTLGHLQILSLLLQARIPRQDE